MDKLLGNAALVASVLGLLICAISGGGRVLGFSRLLNFESLTLFIGGIALMVVACLAKLYQMESVRGGEA